MEFRNLSEILKGNSYPGRGIAIGRSADGKNAVIVYFIMGRSENSRNRVFVTEGDGIRTKAYDPSKLEDPSLIIYAPVRCYENCTIVTNGDQTDTIYDGLSEGLTFTQSLSQRTFEPDAPNYTPRISGLVYMDEGEFDYSISILKSDLGDPGAVLRYTFTYENPLPGEGRFISTYEKDGNPLPSFSGEPLPITVGDNIDDISKEIWESLDAENKVSLFVRTISLVDGTTDTRIINKHEENK